MKLIELMTYLKSKEEAEIFISKELPNVDFDMVILYMKGSIDINSDIRFFDFYKIDNKNQIQIDREIYKGFTSLSELQEMIQSYEELENNKPSDLEIAKRIVRFIKYDG